jgi:hypothetical protein
MTLAQSEPKIVYRICAGCSGDFPPPSPPAEKATARQDQAGQANAITVP